MGYKQNNNPFSRRTSSPLFKGHNRSMTVILPNKNKITTSIDNTNLNEKGETQSFVLNNAYNTIQQRINEANSFADDFNLDNMSLEEATRFDEAEANAMNNLSEAEQNFIRVSDSINNVNKKRFSPIKMTSPLNDNHWEWDEQLQDERGGYDVGEWGNETRTENPDGSITITQTRDLNKKGGGGEGFVNPAKPNQTWDEWLETPEGIEWRSKNPGQDTRSRTIRKREPLKPVSTLTGEKIENVTRDIETPEIKRVVTPMSEDDMNRKRKEIEQQRKDDERSGRKRRRKQWWSNVTGDIGDFVGDIGRGIGNVGKGIGKGAEFVGRGLLDVALAPVDITRGALFPCKYCNKGLGSNIMDRTSLFGGRRGLRKLL